MPHFTHIDDIDIDSPLTIDDNRSLLSIARDAEQTREPIILEADGKPIAAIISLEALSLLYGELRCLRMLNTIASTVPMDSLRAV